MRVLIHEAVGYAAASACALLVDITILWILVHYLSWWYLAAAAFFLPRGIRRRLKVIGRG